MTKSCFQIWVSKMTGDYDRYLTQAVEKMKEASNEFAEDIKSELERINWMYYLSPQMYGLPDMQPREGKQSSRV